MAQNRLSSAAGWLFGAKRENRQYCFGRRHYCLVKYKQCWLGGGFKYFLFSSLFGEMIQFDEHIFQMGGSTTNQLGTSKNKQTTKAVWVPGPENQPWQAISGSFRLALKDCLVRPGLVHSSKGRAGRFSHRFSYPNICKIPGLDHRK